MPKTVDEFRIDRLLGRGATAEVWLAWDTLLERPVAIKVAGRAASQNARARFLTEGRALARLHHPNLLTVHHAGELDDRPFLVTELLEGRSLAEAERPIAPERVTSIGLDVARGLQAAHRAGILHRDIKPANAVMSADGRAKLIDFGMARLEEDLAGTTPAPGPDAALDDTLEANGSAANGLVGTPLYMAPEVWRGEPAARASDVYSLGALLYELLTGRPPFVAEDLAALRQKVLAGPTPALPAGALQDLVHRCLAPAPEHRPTAEELRDALATIMESVAAAADDPSADGNPYRGLLPFGPQHRGLFFGREIETGAVLAELGVSPFVLIVGPSGIGKSSLVRAAIVPRVEAGVLGGGPWRVVAVSPGRRPEERLAEAAAALLGVEEGTAAVELDRWPEWLGQELAARARQGRTLFVLDQLEELATEADAHARSRFIQAILGLTRAGPAVRVVATLRADFLHRLEELGELRTDALRATIVLGPPAREGLLRAVCEPARRRGVEVDRALAERLAQGGSLPIISFALATLWERRNRESARLTVADLDAIGGLEGALAAHADGVLARLTPAERAEARRLLLALVTMERTRARRARSELLNDSEPARRALEALVDGRLLVAGEADEGAVYEVAHEALLTGWPTLARWLDEEAASRAAAERLRRATAEWERLGRHTEGLYGERQLRDVEALDQLGEPERAFLAASRRALRRARRRRIALRVGVPLALLAAAAVGWMETTLRRRAAVRQAVSEAQAAWLEAQEAQRAADALRSSAFTSFDRDDLGPAEDLWRKALAREDEAEADRGRAAGALDRAIVIDARNGSALALYADLTFASLERAERRHRPALASALRSRLGLFDDGSRLAHLAVPGEVRVESEPAGAKLVLYQYVHDGTGRLSESNPSAIVEGERRALPPGSYLITSDLPGRWPTRYPFVIGSGETRALHVVLPPRESIPEGMIYVPAGRFRYGSDDDEEIRAILTHQPEHDQEIGAFLIARTEVTYADYLAFLRALPGAEREARMPEGASLIDGRASVQIGDEKVAEGQAYCRPARPCVDWLKLPVDHVNQEDGNAYARWLAMTGRLAGARLCSDREWERAARGADGRRYPHGDVPEVGGEDACTLISYGRDAHRAGPCLPGGHPASRSPFGVDDLVGNVTEWTASGLDIAQPTIGMARGSSWFLEGVFLWSTNRNNMGRGSRWRATGMRLCATAPEPTAGRPSTPENR